MKQRDAKLGWALTGCDRLLLIHYHAWSECIGLRQNAVTNSDDTLRSDTVGDYKPTHSTLSVHVAARANMISRCRGKPHGTSAKVLLALSLYKNYSYRFRALPLQTGAQSRGYSQSHYVTFRGITMQQDSSSLAVLVVFGTVIRWSTLECPMTIESPAITTEENVILPANQHYGH